MRAASLALFAGCAISCTSVDIDVPIPSSPTSRFLLLGRDAPTCGVVGRLPPPHRLPPLLSEGSGQRYLFEFADGIPGDQEITLARVEADPVIVSTLLSPLPGAIKAWTLDQGKITPIGDEETSDVLAGVGMIAPDHCPEAVEQACNPQFPRCVQPESPKEFILEDGPSEQLDVVTAGSRVFAISNGRLYVIDETGATAIFPDEKFRAITSDGQHGAYLFTFNGCLKRLDADLSLEAFGCVSSDQPQYGAKLALAEDGNIWALDSHTLHVFRNGEPSLVRDHLSFGREVQLMLISNEQAILSHNGSAPNAYWLRPGSLYPLGTTLSWKLARASDGQVLLAEDLSNGAKLYRFDAEAAQRRGEAVIEPYQDVSLFPRVLLWTRYGYVMGGPDGALVRLPEEQPCKIDPIGRMPHAMAMYDRGLVVLGNDVLDFNYLVDRDTRAFVLAFPQPELTCP